MFDTYMELEYFGSVDLQWMKKKKKDVIPKPNTFSAFPMI